MKKLVRVMTALFISLLVFTGLAVKGVIGASPDGNGPWADSVISFSQALTKNGESIGADRSDTSAALGVAENDDSAGSFVSLGFGGSIELGFENPISGGVLVVETTFEQEYYPVETAKVEVSENGIDWIEAGSVSRDASVELPESTTCISYVRIIDTSDVSLFANDITSDGYDVDGVRANGSSECDPGSEDLGNPDPTPGTDPAIGGPSGDSSDSNDGDSSGDGWACAVAKPATPSVRGMRTSDTTVELYWDKVNPTTHYSIVYGVNSGDYQYGVSDVGDTNSYVIGGLDPNKGYYFVVRAVNECMPSEASNQVYIGAESQIAAIGGGDVLGLSTDTLADTGVFSRLWIYEASLLAMAATWAISKKLVA